MENAKKAKDGTFFSSGLRPHARDTRVAVDAARVDFHTAGIQESG